MTTFEKQETTFQDPEIDDSMLKIYEQNIERIVNLSKRINVTHLITIFSFLIFCLSLAIRLVKSTTFSFLYLLVPALISLLSFTMLLNTYLKLKDIFDEAEKKRIEHSDNDIESFNKPVIEEDSYSIGSNLSYLCLNSASLLICVYAILLALRVEGLITFNWNIITIPIYLILGLALFYAIFILPAFIQNKLNYEIALIFTYIICSVIFLVMLNLNLDGNANYSYVNIFIPLFFVIGMNCVYSIVNVLSDYKNNMLFSRISNLFLIFGIFCATALVALKADKLLPDMADWVPVLVFASGYFFYMFEKLLAIVMGEKDE